MALLLKQLHKFYCKADTPWVKLVWSLYSPNVAPHAQTHRGSFWWRDIFSLIDTYWSITTCKIGDGETVLFWKDFWHDNELLCDKLPRLFSYVLYEDATVAEVANSPNLFSSLDLPILVEAFEELNFVQSITQDLITEHAGLDVRSFPLGNQSYTLAKFYEFLFSALPEDPALSAIWKSKRMPKLRVFGWLLLMDRLNTKDLMLSKNWHVDGGISCVLCTANTVETWEHLFFNVPLQLLTGT
jgi:hypothetical protein